ncbi:MAG: DUF929 family protein [Candidatus Micrarchaeaceae archaeon]|nr:DUF929 domain-containing protein [Candidatus Marsarchaeota archaeon]
MPKDEIGGREIARKLDAISITLYIITALLVIVVALMVYQSLFKPAYAYQQPANTIIKNTTSLTNHSTANTSKYNFGHRLTNIDVPLNSSALAVFNFAPNSYFETAGEMLLNGSITNQVMDVPVSNSSIFKPLMINGKPTVIYIGAISCIFCGENRWAMALALGRFGNFSNLYTGYSSFGDHDVPTLYWTADNYTTPENVGFGNSYTSKYINFISADYESPIVQGFEVQPLSYFVSKASSVNQTYLKAMEFMNSTNQFQGTPFTFWGKYLVGGADAVDFSNSSSSSNLTLEYMTHAQMYNELSNPNDQIGWTEYAGADVYIAYICSTLNSTGSAEPPICSLPAIKSIEKVMDLG